MPTFISVHSMNLKGSYTCKRKHAGSYVYTSIIVTFLGIVLLRMSYKHGLVLLHGA